MNKRSLRKIKNKPRVSKKKSNNGRRRSSKKTQKKQTGGNLNTILLSMLGEKYIPYLPTLKTVTNKSLIKIYLSSVSGFKLLSIIGNNDKFINSNRINSLIDDNDDKSMDIFKSIGSISKLPAARKFLANFTIDCSVLGADDDLRAYILDCEDHLSVRNVDWFEAVLGLKQFGTDKAFERAIKDEMIKRRIVLDTDTFRDALDILKNNHEVRDIFKQRILDCAHKPQGFFDSLFGKISWDSYNECFKCSDNSCVVHLDDNYKSFLRHKSTIPQIKRIKVLMWCELRLREMSKHFALEALRIKKDKTSKVKSLLRKIYNEDVKMNKVGDYTRKQIVMRRKKPLDLLQQRGGAHEDDAPSPAPVEPPAQPVAVTDAPAPVADDQPVVVADDPAPVADDQPVTVAAEPVAMQAVSDTQPGLLQGELTDIVSEESPPIPAQQVVPQPTAQPMPAEQPMPVAEQIQSDVSEDVSELKGPPVAEQPVAVAEQPLTEQPLTVAEDTTVEDKGVDKGEVLEEQTPVFSKMIYVSFNGTIEKDEQKELIAEQVGENMREVCKLTNPARLKIYRVRVGPRTVSIEIGIEDNKEDELNETQIKDNIVEAIVDQTISRKLVMPELNTVKDIYFDGISKYEQLSKMPSQFKRVLLEMDGMYPTKESERIDFEANIIESIVEILEEPKLDRNRLHLENITEITSRPGRVFVQFLLMNGKYEKKSPHEILMKFKEKYSVNEGDNDFAKKYNISNVIFGEPSVILDKEDIETMKTLAEEKSNAVDIDFSTFENLESDYERVAYHGCDITLDDLKNNVITAYTPLSSECEETLSNYMRGY